MITRVHVEVKRAHSFRILQDSPPNHMASTSAKQIPVIPAEILLRYTGNSRGYHHRNQAHKVLKSEQYSRLNKQAETNFPCASERAASTAPEQRGRVSKAKQNRTYGQNATPKRMQASGLDKNQSPVTSDMAIDLNKKPTVLTVDQADSMGTVADNNVQEAGKKHERRSEWVLGTFVGS